MNHLRQRGYLMILAAGLITVASSVAVILNKQASKSISISEYNQDSAKAFYIAQAGLESATLEWNRSDAIISKTSTKMKKHDHQNKKIAERQNKKKKKKGDNAPTPDNIERSKSSYNQFAGGGYSIKEYSTDFTNQPLPDSQTRIRSIGRFNNATRVVEQIVEKSSPDRVLNILANGDFTDTKKNQPKNWITRPSSPRSIYVSSGGVDNSPAIRANYYNRWSSSSKGWYAGLYQKSQANLPGSTQKLSLIFQYKISGSPSQTIDVEYKAYIYNRYHRRYLGKLKINKQTDGVFVPGSIEFEFPKPLSKLAGIEIFLETKNHNTTEMWIDDLQITVPNDGPEVITIKKWREVFIENDNDYNYSSPYLDNTNTTDNKNPGDEESSKKDPHNDDKSKGNTKEQKHNKDDEHKRPSWGNNKKEYDDNTEHNSKYHNGKSCSYQKQDYQNHHDAHNYDGDDDHRHSSRSKYSKKHGDDDDDDDRHSSRSKHSKKHGDSDDDDDDDDDDRHSSRSKHSKKHGDSDDDYKSNHSNSGYTYLAVPDGKGGYIYYGNK